jgi:hypothetical protein
MFRLRERGRLMRYINLNEPGGLAMLDLELERVRQKHEDAFDLDRDLNPADAFEPGYDPKEDD